MGFVKMSILNINGAAFVENEDGSEKKRVLEERQKEIRAEYKNEFHTFKYGYLSFRFFYLHHLIRHPKIQLIH